MMRFDLLTERAQDAAMRAYEVLQRYGHVQVDTEHLLLALIEQPKGVIPEILKQIGVDPEATGHRLDQELRRTPRSQIFGQGESRVYITPRLKRVLDQSHKEASKLEDDYVSTEHLLLAIASERNTPASRILVKAGVTRERILGAMEELDSIRESGGSPRWRPPPDRLHIDRVVGEVPELVLSQGDNQVRIALRDAMAVIARLADAAQRLATVQADGRRDPAHFKKHAEAPAQEQAAKPEPVPVETETEDNEGQHKEPSDLDAEGE
jgi:ATP-dependent Clp protease ATP-binding subunit ClpA